MSWGVSRAIRVAAYAAALCIAGWAVLLAPGSALASQSAFPQGTAGSPFDLVTPLGADVVVSGAEDQSVSLKVGELQVIDAGTQGYVSLGVSQADPRSVDVLSGGGVLVADVANRLVAEFDANGALVWSYTAADDADLRTPVRARRLAGGRTLICDSGAARVFIIDDQSGKVEWQYGETGAAGSGPDRLDAPTSAAVLSDGNVVICDAGNHRVIVVRAGDYNATSADAGFTADSIVWQYGTTGVSGDGVDQLVTPTSAQRLTAGASRDNVLICDAGAARVIEVRYADYASSGSSHGFTAGSIVWQYPASGSETASLLSSPSWALGSYGADNVVWIADAGRRSVLGVATGSISGRPTRHQKFAEYGSSSGTPFSGSLSAPAALSQATDGRLAVADPGGRRVVVLGTTTDAGSVTSRSLDCGLSKRKRFATIRCTFARVPSAPIAVSYLIDSGSWKLLGMFGGKSDMSAGSGAKTVPFPPLTAGQRISYQVTLSTGSRACAPALRSLTISYEPWRSKMSGSGGGGVSGNRRDSNGGSGTYNYPVSSGGSGAGSGGGVGGGTGSGSGSGAGNGRGSGSSGNAAGSDTGAAGGSSSGVEMPSAVSTSTGGAATRSVSGYVIKASGVAGGGEGGGASLAFAGLPLVPLAALVVGAALMVGPGAGRRRLRLFADWDPELVRPFPAERTRGRPRPRPAPLMRPRRRW